MREPVVRSPVIHLTDIACAALATSAGFAWLLYGLLERSLAVDDGISFAAAQGVARHGVPVLPSGFIYDRAYLAHYLTGGSLKAFGPELGVLAVGLLCAVGSLVVTYRLGRDVLEQPIVGLVAAVLVSLSAEQAYYATSPRMYMALQFFGVLAVYAGYRGFVRDERAFRIVTGLSLSAAMLCERGGAALLVAIAVALFVTLRPSRRALKGSVALLVTLPTLYLLFVWKPQNAYVPMVSEGGRIPQFIALNTEPAKWLAHLLQLERLVPFALALMLAGVVAWAGQRALKKPGVVYVGVVLVLTLAGVMATMNYSANRFFHFLLPLITLVMATGLMALMSRQRLAFGAAFVAAAMTLHFYDTNPTANYYARCALGLPRCDRETAPEVRRTLELLARELRPSDVVIASNPWVTYFYLGQVDGFLRQRFNDDDSFGEFPRRTDEYYGATMIDSTDALLSLLGDLAPEQRAIFVLDFKAEAYASRELLDAVKSHTITVLAEPPVAIYAAQGMEPEVLLTDVSLLDLEPGWAWDEEACVDGVN